MENRQPAFFARPKNQNVAVKSSSSRRIRFRRVGSWIMVVAVSVGFATGCRLCADCDTQSYPSYGGAWQRTLRDSGRVGSVFDPGGSRQADLSARVGAEEMEEENRRRNSSGESKPDSPKKDPTEKPEDGKPEKDLRDRNFDNDEQLRDMEDRLRDLNLQDIDYQQTRPPVVR